MCVCVFVYTSYKAKVSREPAYSSKPSAPSLYSPFPRALGFLQEATLVAQFEEKRLSTLLVSAVLPSSPSPPTLLVYKETKRKKVGFI